MSDSHDESNSHKPDQAGRMQEGYAKAQERALEGGQTSAGGAGSTGTPGNSDDLDDTAQETGEGANTARDSGE